MLNNKEKYKCHRERENEQQTVSGPDLPNERGGRP